MGVTGYLTLSMYYSVELVKVKVMPRDFLRDSLLRAKLIDKYKGTMTGPPNFAYKLFAKRLRRHARPGQFDLYEGPCITCTQSRRPAVQGIVRN